MNKRTLFLIAAALTVAPAQAQVVLPMNFKLPTPTTTVSYKELEKTEQRYRLGGRVFTVYEDKKVIRRIPEEPFQLYAGSQTRIHRALSVLLRQSF